MIRDPGILFDGQLAIRKGMHSGIAPSGLALDQVSFAINTTFRRDFPMQRPGWSPVTLVFDEDDADIEENFNDTLFQNAFYYEDRQDNDCLITVAGGRVFRISLPDFAVMDITPDGDDVNIPTWRNLWMAQGEEFLIIQNGKDSPIIYDGVACRRAVSGETPVGSVMTYALGRFWVASPDGYSFVASDLVYTDKGTEQYSRRDAILKFTENTFLNEGGAFGVPAQAGRITAMSAIANLDTSLGQGPLQVFTERGSFSVNAPFDRTTWKDLTSPIITVSSSGKGPKGADSLVPVNGDLWFRADDGLRTFQVARRNFNTWVNANMSEEMERVIGQDAVPQLDKASGVLFDNRLLATCAPQFDGTYGTYHLGLIALNFDNVSGVTEVDVPNYDGVWTGLRIHKIVAGQVNGEERCFMFVRDASNYALELWELSKDDPYDDTDRKITWVLEGPSFKFGAPGDLKSLEGADLWLDQVHGDVDVTVKYRPDQYPCWTTWHTYSTCATMENCSTDTCATMYDLKRQHRSRVMVPRPEVAVDETNGVQMNYGYEFQLRLEFSGPCRLMKTRVRARQQPELPGGSS